MCKVLLITLLCINNSNNNSYIVLYPVINYKLLVLYIINNKTNLWHSVKKRTLQVLCMHTTTLKHSSPNHPLCVHTHTHTHTHTHYLTEITDAFPDSTESLSLVFSQRWVTFSEIIWVRSSRLCRMFTVADFNSFMSDLLTLIQFQGYICIVKMKVKVVRTFASSCSVELELWMLHGHDPEQI